MRSGLRLTAWVRPRGPRNANASYEAICAMERALLELLAESEPDADDGEWRELALRPLNQRLVDAGHKSHPETLRRLLRSLRGRQGTRRQPRQSRARLPLARTLPDPPAAFLEGAA